MFNPRCAELLAHARWHARGFAASCFHFGAQGVLASASCNGAFWLRVTSSPRFVPRYCGPCRLAAPGGQECSFAVCSEQSAASQGPLKGAHHEPSPWEPARGWESHPAVPCPAQRRCASSRQPVVPAAVCATSPRPGMTGAPAAAQVPPKKAQVCDNLVLRADRCSSFGKRSCSSPASHLEGGFGRCNCCPGSQGWCLPTVRLFGLTTEASSASAVLKEFKCIAREEEGGDHTLKLALNCLLLPAGGL